MDAEPDDETRDDVENQSKIDEVQSVLQLRLTTSEQHRLFSSILQIVLSHHFQKPEITCLL